MYRVEYLRSAQKALRRTPHDLAERFVESLERLAADPAAAGLEVKPLRGRPGWRLRMGGWWAIYRVEDQRLVILVLDVGPRGDICK